MGFETPSFLYMTLFVLMPLLARINKRTSSRSVAFPNVELARFITKTSQLQKLMHDGPLLIARASLVGALAIFMAGPYLGYSSPANSKETQNVIIFDRALGGFTPEDRTDFAKSKELLKLALNKLRSFGPCELLLADELCLKADNDIDTDNIRPSVGGHVNIELAIRMAENLVSEGGQIFIITTQITAPHAAAVDGAGKSIELIAPKINLADKNTLRDSMHTKNNFVSLEDKQNTKTLRVGVVTMGKKSTILKAIAALKEAGVRIGGRAFTVDEVTKIKKGSIPNYDILVGAKKYIAQNKSSFPLHSCLSNSSHIDFAEGFADRKGYAMERDAIKFGDANLTGYIKFSRTQLAQTRIIENIATETPLIIETKCRQNRSLICTARASELASSPRVFLPLLTKLLSRAANSITPNIIQDASNTPMAVCISTLPTQNNNLHYILSSKNMEYSLRPRQEEDGTALAITPRLDAGTYELRAKAKINKMHCVEQTIIIKAPAQKIPVIKEEHQKYSYSLPQLEQRLQENRPRSLKWLFALIIILLLAAEVYLQKKNGGDE